MKSTKLLLLGIFLILPFFVLSAGCGGGGGNSAPAPVLVSITVTPANPTLASGTSLQLTATGIYSNNSSADITESASWSSTVTGVAVVNDTAGSKGRITAVAAGTTEITAMVGSVSGSTTLTVTGGVAAATNVMTVTVNGSLCSASSYLNKACVSVTVCNPGSSTCQTIPDILLDTGSYGLRIFKEALPGLTLTQVTSGSGSLAECVQFADQSAMWGPVQLADIKMGGEPAVRVPIQVVDSTFGTPPSACASAQPNVATAGLSGILGVGVATEDCGPACVSNAGIGIYYRCTGTNCLGTTAPLASQVQNPVAHLPQDNNGVLVQLPAVPAGGVVSASGSLIFGIGTQTNNNPVAKTLFPTDQFGDFRTVYKGVNGPSFLDTGSNGLFFPNEAPALPLCPSPNSAWYCPQTTLALSASTVGAFGSPSANIPFNVSNFLGLAQSPNYVFSDIAGPSTFGFDWGVPFFMGRDVYLGINGRPSVIGNGPFVAY